MGNGTDSGMSPKLYHKHGTTILGTVCKNDYIGVVADGRTFVMKKGECYPFSEDDSKIFQIGEDFVASIGGSSFYGRSLVIEIEGLYKEKKENMEMVIKNRNLKLNDWKNDILRGKENVSKKRENEEENDSCEEEDDEQEENDSCEEEDDEPFKEQMAKNAYPASVIVYGFDDKNVHIAANGEDVEQAVFVVQGQTLKVVGHGAGGKDALVHLKEIKNRMISLEAALECMKEAIASVSLKRIFCGGNFQVATATRVGGIKILDERPHITEIIANHFETLRQYTKLMLLCYSEGSYLESPVLERVKEEFLLTTYPGLVEIGIIGYDEASKRTLRWLRFESEEYLNNLVDDPTPRTWFNDAEFVDPTKNEFEVLSNLFKKSKEI